MTCEIQVVCTHGKLRQQVARFVAEGDLGTPRAGRAVWLSRGGDEKLVTESRGVVDLHQTYSIPCKWQTCPLKLDLRGVTMQRIVGPLADHGVDRIEFIDFIRLVDLATRGA